MRKKPRQAVLTDAPPTAFLHRARGFLRIANTSYEEYCNPGGDFPTDLLARPLHFLYSHSAELAMKSFLRSKVIPIEGTALKIHLLAKLYDSCCAAGMGVNPAHNMENKNVLGLLDKGNENQGFRYFSTANAEPEVWLAHDVVNRLVAAIDDQLRDLDVPDLVPVRLMFIMGGPDPKTKT
jgi:hypothetical protein